MELWQEILQKSLNSDGISTEKDIKELLASKCYNALIEIKKIVQDDTLDDPECFMRVERIVCVLEELGSNGGSRHDFG